MATNKKRYGNKKIKQNKQKANKSQTIRLEQNRLHQFTLMKMPNLLIKFTLRATISELLQHPQELPEEHSPTTLQRGKTKTSTMKSKVTNISLSLSFRKPGGLKYLERKK